MWSVTVKLKQQTLLELDVVYRSTAEQNRSSQSSRSSLGIENRISVQIKFSILKQVFADLEGGILELMVYSQQVKPPCPSGNWCEALMRWGMR